MKLDLETIKQTLAYENEITVNTSSFNEDMETMKEYYESDKDLVDFAIDYLSEIFGFNISIEVSEQYVKFIKS